MINKNSRFDAAMIRRNLEAKRYEGTNETINQYMEDDDVVWIVQGSRGRVPILANTEDEAKAAYVKKYAVQIEADQEHDEFESQE